MNIKDQIKDVQQKIEDLNFQLRVEEAVLERLQNYGSKKKRNSSSKFSGPPKKNSLAAHVLNVLKESNEPKTVEQLVAALKERGVENGSKTGLDILIPSAIARRNDLFARVKRGVYDLKSRVKENPAE